MGVLVELVMKRDVLALAPEMSLKQMDRALLKHHVSGAPVVDRGRLVGIASLADVIRLLYQDQSEAARVSDIYSSPFPIPVPALEALAKDSQRITKHLAESRVRDVMTPNPLTVSPSDDVETAARLMATERIHRVPVVQDDELVGIVSSLDIMRLVGDRGLAGGSQ
jgi:CBS domain-containing protein